MTSKNYIFKKTHDVDKTKFAMLLIAAKGGRTMKDFADACGVNPSTFTRISQQANKGASSIDLIQAIADNAAPSSGVTLEALADANGYTVERDRGIVAMRIANSNKNNESLTKDILVQELLDRGAEVRMGKIRYDFGKTMSLSPDALIMTNAFGGERDIWMVESLFFSGRTMQRNPALPRDGHPLSPSEVKQRTFQVLSRFVFIAMMRETLFKPSLYSIVVYDKDIYDVIVEEFNETVVPAEISIILIDALNSTIVEEYLLPSVGSDPLRKGYFTTTAKQGIDESREYISTVDIEDLI